MVTKAPASPPRTQAAPPPPKPNAKPQETSSRSMPDRPRTETVYVYDSSPPRSSVYETVQDITPNALYRRYKRWFREKHGDNKTPLSFRQWLKWAQNRGIVNADGEVSSSKPSAPEKKELTPEEKIARARKIDRTIAVLALSFTAIGVIIAATRK